MEDLATVPKKFKTTHLSISGQMVWCFVGKEGNGEACMYMPWCFIIFLVGNGNLDLGATEGSFSRIRQSRLNEGLLLCFLAKCMVPYI